MLLLTHTYIYNAVHALYFTLSHLVDQYKNTKSLEKCAFTIKFVFILL